MTFIILSIAALLVIGAGMVVMRTASTNDELREEICKLRSTIAEYRDRRSLSAFAYVTETPAYVRVVMSDYGQEYEVRAFPKGNDPDYALLCATELADAINSDF